MTQLSPSAAPDDALVQAATLAFALVRFEEGAAHPPRNYSPPGVPRIGTEAYVFIPSLRRVPRDAVVSFLAALPSPALLTPSTRRGIVALTLVDELTGDRAAGGLKVLSNQRAALDEMLRHFGLGPDARVLLEFDDEAHVVSLEAMRLWAERFAVHVGWNIQSLEGDPRASARMMLFRSDGGHSLGGACPVVSPS